MQSSTIQSIEEGLGRKKTMFVMVTVVACIAILFPMLFGSSSTPKQKEFKAGGTGECCDVILDKETFMNITAQIGPQLYRKKLNIYLGEINLSLRQERPPHLRPENLHPAMRERGRAIPTTQTVPIVDRGRNVKDSPPRIVEGRPGPIPGMRPPMGAGSVHQPQPKGSSMGFIMPLYTVGIVAFFLYTIMKLVFKKQIPNAPYGPVGADPKFRKEVFGEDTTIYSKKHDDSTNPKIVVTAIQGLIDAADEQLKRRENATNLSKESTENSTSTAPQNGNISNGHTNNSNDVNKSTDLYNNRVENLNDDENDPKIKSNDLIKNEKDYSNSKTPSDRKKHDAVTVLGMELTTSCEGGQKWSRPTTPVFFAHRQHSSHDDSPPAEPQSIYLEGSLPHESQILVADSEVRSENVIDSELNGTEEEPAVVLSSKMTLSLINLSSADEGSDEEQSKSNGSPLDEDMEIIGNDI